MTDRYADLPDEERAQLEAIERKNGAAAADDYAELLRKEHERTGRFHSTTATDADLGGELAEIHERQSGDDDPLRAAARERRATRAAPVTPLR